DYVVPLPLDSLNANETLRHFGLAPDVLHIDAGHDYRAVSTDIAVWWPLLRPGGVMVGDDYMQAWPEVKRAFDDFEAREFGGAVEHEAGKCIFQKPAEG
ncbi:MAG TPA: class I SAM-dependent methyltransferase, partial [Acidocella sp.]|nr:class I SAM-dependent methyltransferase [Acidocella sp.]